jgi:hypothetical protein
VTTCEERDQRELDDFGLALERAFYGAPQLEQMLKTLSGHRKRGRTHTKAMLACDGCRLGQAKTLVQSLTLMTKLALVTRRSRFFYRRPARAVRRFGVISK